jgi:hypothetical protein
LLQLTDESLTLIARTCISLQYLDVFGLPNVTIEGIKRIVQSCSTLLEMNVDTRLQNEANEILKEVNRTAVQKSKVKIFSARPA